MPKVTFEIADDKTFNENMQTLSQSLVALDSDLGPVLEKYLRDLADGTVDKNKVWDALVAAVPEQKQ